MCEQDRRVSIDIVFSVALVQIGIRYYEGSLWKHVENILEVDNMPLTHRSWIGGTVTETLLAFGKPIYNRQEHVTNILMHCFVTDSFAYRFFDYLFQYYNIDMERNLSELDEDDIEHICFSIKNPFSKRKQLLSKYLSMSIRGDEEYCKRVICTSLYMIDQEFWEEYTGGDFLTGRLATRFEEWKNQSNFYRIEKSNNENTCLSEERVKKFRKPHLICNMENVEFKVVFPVQFILTKDEHEIHDIRWRLVSSTRTDDFQCILEEGYSGLKTREVTVSLNEYEIFDALCFALLDGNTAIRTFLWKKRSINFFDSAGKWVSSEAIAPGLLYGFTCDGTEVCSEAIMARYKRKHLIFYELNISKGELICVEGEANYYVGDIPEIGLSMNKRMDNVSIIDEKGKKIPVFNGLPSFVVEVADNEFEGTAVFVNDKITRLSANDFTKIYPGRNSTKKYYVFNLSSFHGIIDGINNVLIDFPGGKGGISSTFAYLNRLEFDFEDAPYIYQNKGTLILNRKIEHGIIKGDILGARENYDFSIMELERDRLVFPWQCGQYKMQVEFQVPILLYSWDEKQWFNRKPEDIWHTELNSILYVKYPLDQISLGVKGEFHGEATFVYKKTAKGYFECDLTKLKSHFDNRKMVNYISLLSGNHEYEMFRIIMKSFLSSAMLEADYEKDCVICRFDIIGKGTYFADIQCENEMLVEKGAIINGSIEVAVSIRSAEYTVKVYETDGKFSFDDDYDLIGESTITLLDPQELTNKCMKVNTIYEQENNYMSLELASIYLLYINEQIDRYSYLGIMTEVFMHNTVINASEVVITIQNLNELKKVTVTFLDEFGDQSEFLYDNYAKSIVENEYCNISKSEAYRRYEMLYTDTFIWEVSYIQKNSEIQKKGDELIARKKADLKKKSFWRYREVNDSMEIPIDQLSLNTRTYNCMKTTGFRTLGDIHNAYQQGKLVNIRNLGRKNYENLCQLLKKHDLLQR